MTHWNDWSGLAAVGAGLDHLTVVGGQISAAGTQMIGLKFVAEQTNLTMAVGLGLTVGDGGRVQKIVLEFVVEQTNLTVAVGHGLAVRDGGRGLVV